MIPRIAANALQRLARGFPIVALTGPRQSGKTTLARACFAGKAYVSLENPDEREFAERDPRRFLQRFADGAILDEVQRCPDLLSWLQGIVDERGRMGDFILTGSAQFDLLSGITQSLAGRVGRVELLPLSLGDRGIPCMRPTRGFRHRNEDGTEFIQHQPGLLSPVSKFQRFSLPAATS